MHIRAANVQRHRHNLYDTMDVTATWPWPWCCHVLAAHQSIVVRGISIRAAMEIRVLALRLEFVEIRIAKLNLHTCKL